MYKPGVQMASVNGNCPNDNFPNGKYVAASLLYIRVRKCYVPKRNMCYVAFLIKFHKARITRQFLLLFNSKANNPKSCKATTLEFSM